MKILQRALYVFTVIYWIFILVLTHIPALPPPPMQMSDKIAHLGAFGMLGGLLFLCAWSLRPSRRLFPLIVLPIGFLYGALDERTQPWFHRTCDFMDWVFDAMGLTIAVGSMMLIRPLLEKLFAKKSANGFEVK